MADETLEVHVIPAQINHIIDGEIVVAWKIMVWRRGNDYPRHIVEPIFLKEEF
jgi:hypothetical protein